MKPVAFLLLLALGAQEDDLAPDFDRAAETFARLALEEKDSYQRFLWRSQTWLERALLRRSWDQILASLERQKIGLSDGWEESGVQRFRFLLKKDALATPQGQKIDLLLAFEVTRRFDPEHRSARTVKRASVLLIASIRLPIQRVISGLVFPGGSAVVNALGFTTGDPELIAKYPKVEEVELRFGLIPDERREAPGFPSGFHVRFTLVDRLEGRTDQAYVHLTVTSGLEPLRTLSGESLDPKHVPQDSVLGSFPNGIASNQLLGLGLKRLDLPVPREYSFEPSHDRARVSEAWSLPDLEALPDTIRALRIRGSFLSDDGMKALARFQELETLQFRFGERADALRNVSDEGFKLLGELKRLKRLELQDARQLGDPGLEALSGLAELEDLDLTTPTRIGDPGLTMLGKLPRLRALKLFALKNATTAGWQALSHSTSLRELELRSCALDDAGLAEIGKIQDLEYLACRERDKEHGSVTDEGLLGLAGLKNLRRLQLMYTQATPDGVRALQARLPGRYVSH